jgi:hypothetical protein
MREDVDENMLRIRKKLSSLSVWCVMGEGERIPFWSV